MIRDIINKYNDLGIKYITDIYTDNAIYVFICSLPNGRFMVYENTDPQSICKTKKQAEDFIKNHYYVDCIWQETDEEVALPKEIYIYKAKFYFSNRLVNEYDAQKYLNDDDYTTYIKQSTLTKTLRLKIKNIKWILTSVLSGYIEVQSYGELSEQENEELLQWCSDFQVNELNDGFENQAFANYNVNNIIYSNVDYKPNDEINVVASFLPIKRRIFNYIRKELA